MQNILKFDSTRQLSSAPGLDRDEFDLTPFLSKENGLPSDLNTSFRTLDAWRIKISHVYDKLSSLSNSRTRLLPHQIEATHRVAEALKPRFILADEVGLGKTIEAGLVIKELILRRGYNRILVVTPATLCLQWQQEMKTKFNEEFQVLNRKTFSSYAGKSPKKQRTIVSLDFIKNPRYSSEVLKTNWDIVVFDEAHRLRRDYSKVTQAYSFAAEAALRCEALLLLTATPFRGKLEELYYLIQLVDPDLLGPHYSFVQDYMQAEKNERMFAHMREKISRVMIRRRKVEVGGFTKRFACTVVFDMSETERILYDETTEYVKREYNLAMANKNRAVGFIMIVFQKLLDSSTRALLRALERRKASLEKMMYGAGNALSLNEYFDMSEDELEDIIEDELSEEIVDSDKCEKKRMQDFRREILVLSRLIHLGRSIRTDRKIIKLKETLSILKKEGHTKFVIFTQFRTTLEYLQENLTDFSITPFHGSLSAQQKEDAVLEFKNKTEIFICTEAGGEGRNLQFASILFNYDLPWSPLKIEQRIGRIHRFGQKKDVKIFNFSTKNTVAERVLRILDEKIKLFEQSIGPSDAILGAVENEINFQNSMMNFVTGKKTRAEFNQELESSFHVAESGYKKLNELVAPQCMDFNLRDYYEHTKKERTIENREIENLSLQYLNDIPEPNYKLDMQKKRGATGSALYNFTSTTEKRTIPREATFCVESALQNDNLDFLAVGHPLVDSAIEYYLQHPNAKIVHEIPKFPGMERGYYFVSVCHYLNGISRAELLTCMIPEDSSRKPYVPEESLIPPGTSVENFVPSDKRFTSWENDKQLMHYAKTAHAVLKKEAALRATTLFEKSHGIFKKEEYKLEISAGKKIRHLQEKLERQKLRLKMEPRIEYRASVTRTENELMKEFRRMELEKEKIRRDSRVESKLELLQIYRVV